MNNVIAFPPTSTLTPEQAIASAMTFATDVGLSDVLIVGYDMDGDLFTRSSRMDRKDALGMAERLRQYALDV